MSTNVVDMGFEFKICLSGLDPKEAEQVLRAGPFFERYDSLYDLFNFRAPEQKQRKDDWVTLVAKIEPDGIYLCHYGNKRAFQAVVDHIRQHIPETTHDFRMDEL